MIVGEDGNVAPAEVSGGKTVYSGAITDLIKVDSTGKIITVTKDFDIEYMSSNGSTVYSLSSSVFKGSYTFPSNSGHRLNLAMTDNEHGSNSGGPSWIEIVLSYGELVITVRVGNFTASQITTENVVISDNEYYKLYV